MGCAAQVTAASLTGGLGKEVRSAAGLFMVNNLVHIIASDAHRMIGRPPGLSRAVEAATKIVGASKALAMVTEVPRAILENKALPDWGEPENPLRHKTWTQRLVGMPKRAAGRGAAGPGRRGPGNRLGSGPTSVFKIK
jgi:tyrosine-protein phosphatase YwqE